MSLADSSLKEGQAKGRGGLFSPEVSDLHCDIVILGGLLARCSALSIATATTECNSSSTSWASSFEVALRDCHEVGGTKDSLWVSGAFE